MVDTSGIIGAVFIVYAGIMLWIGYIVSRSTYSPTDFFLANRSLKAWVTAVSSTASSESAWAVLGTVGLAYKDGLSALWFFPGCLLGYGLNGFCVAERLRKYSREKKIITIPCWIYRFTRFGQTVMSVNFFDWFAGKVMGIYKTMEDFKGRR